MPIEPGADAGAHVAQLAEHVLGKDEVISSSLIMGSSFQARPKSERRVWNAEAGWNENLALHGSRR